MGITYKINKDVHKLNNEHHIYPIQWRIKQLISHDD